MTTTDKTFGTYIGCMDGRIQQLAIEYAKERFGVTALDNVSDPAIVSILSGKQFLPSQPVGLKEWERFKAEKISAGQHGSKFALVVGHAGCAGHTDSTEEHIEDIARAVQQVFSWNVYDQVVGLYGEPDEAGTWTLRPVKGGERGLAK